MNKALLQALAGIADSLASAGAATAPGAGAAIATLAAPPAGVYRVRVNVTTGAGSVAADNANAALKAGATTIAGRLPTTGNDVDLDRVTLDGATALTVNAVGAATAAVVYQASIVATRIA